MIKLVLLRHGQSIWNKENRFTGWTDIDLSEQGIREAKEAGKILKKKGFTFDLAFTSVLKRGIRTLWLVLDEMDLMWIPVQNSWRLNERHYGALQGLNKAEMSKLEGEETVQLWRRSYDVRPPVLKLSDKRHPKHDPRYADLKASELPGTECLKDTVKRFLPYWNKAIVPALRAGKRVIISAHGNSLRALVKHLDGISDKAITELNIPTGIPLVYELDKNLKPVRSYYLGDPKKVAKATATVKNQLKG